METTVIDWWVLGPILYILCACIVAIPLLYFEKRQLPNAIRATIITFWPIFVPGVLLILMSKIPAALKWMGEQDGKS
jgi:hypothetical protein